MFFKKKNQVQAHQKKFLYIALTLLGGVGVALFCITSDDEPTIKRAEASPVALDVISEELDPHVVRLSYLETQNETMGEQLSVLLDALHSLEKQQGSGEGEKEQLKAQAKALEQKVAQLEGQMVENSKARETLKTPGALKAWERAGKKEDRHVAYEIPAGTVLKAVLVSGADCSVAISKPTGPNMVLLRPIDNGKLPRNVKVPLKGSVILGNAIGDISSERVYIRAERLTLVEKNGSFIETEVSAYISGEDGREGMRGVVVDRSGQIVSRAAFTAFMQGLGGAIHAAIQSQSFKSLFHDKDSLSASALSGGAVALGQGSITGFGKLSDYYIKRAEQLQPAIQIAAGRVVDVVFTKSVKLGEKNLQKKFELERSAKKT